MITGPGWVPCISESQFPDHLMGVLGSLSPDSRSLPTELGEILTHQSQADPTEWQNPHPTPPMGPPLFPDPSGLPK